MKREMIYDEVLVGGTKTSKRNERKKQIHEAIKFPIKDDDDIEARRQSQRRQNNMRKKQHSIREGNMMQ